MTHFLPLAIALLMLGTLIVLALGVLGLTRKTSGSPQRSNKLMQYRVLFQFAALVVFALTMWLFGRH